MALRTIDNLMTQCTNYCKCSTLVIVDCLTRPLLRRMVSEHLCAALKSFVPLCSLLAQWVVCNEVSFFVYYTMKHALPVLNHTKVYAP